ncbi:trypsin-like serine protease [Specibacter cremeus]|uniref:trypsin-like serine protease n=1 Tax=Specibacter cremeus TaxID=1629051 RepID=UPI00197C3446|nr:trypsin-like serine protease [Specibacter cremeus]
MTKTAHHTSAPDRNHGRTPLRRRWVGITAPLALALAGGLAGALPAHATTGPEAPANTSASVVKVDTGIGTCTGTLVSRLWVVTAASCFTANPADYPSLTAGAPPRPAKVLTGADAATRDKPGTAVLQIQTAPAALARDIVLVELALPIDTITPAKVAVTAPQASETLTFTGFGRTATEWVPDKPHTSDFQVGSLAPSTLTVTPATPGAALCAGDGGAPGIRTTPSGPELAAIVSTSTQGGCLYSQATDSNATATRIDDLIDWIATTTATESAHASSHLIKTNDVVASDAAKLLYRYPGNGKTQLGMREVIGSGWTGLKAGFVADWNGDGIQDIVAQTTDGRLDVYLGSTSGYLRPISLGTSWKDWTLVVGRWKKADKNPGIIGYNATGSLVYLGNPTGTTLAPAVAIGNGWTGLGLTMIDFDKDGNLDLLAKDTAGELKLYRSNGAAGFIAETRPVVGVGWSTITSMNPIYDFAGTGSAGVVARDVNGLLRYYPVTAPRTWGTPIQIGNSWNPMTIFGQTPR